MDTTGISIFGKRSAQQNEQRHRNERVWPPQYEFNYPHKAKAAFGISLVVNSGERPAVSWRVSSGCKPSFPIRASTRSGKIRCGKKEISHALASSSSIMRRMISPESGYAFW